ncbi:hypothetical protein [Streptomyces sp. ARC12]|uniref:hypothetical protein n=1 Tax=Streptomyces sp. ARC12 TaxID=2724151 RepID=UPI003857659C
MSGSGERQHVPVQGAPCWVNLMVADLDVARAFYGEVLGWRFRPSSLDDQFLVATAGGDPVAGLAVVLRDRSVRPEAGPSYTGWCSGRAGPGGPEAAGKSAVGPATIARRRGVLSAVAACISTTETSHPTLVTRHDLVVRILDDPGGRTVLARALSRLPSNCAGSATRSTASAPESPECAGRGSSRAVFTEDVVRTCQKTSCDGEEKSGGNDYG